MYACSPDWNGDWITVGDLRKILSQLKDLIQPSPFGPEAVSLNHGLHFTGGEPFLNFPLLCTAVEMAHSYGIPSLFVETNCFWCVDEENTMEKLTILKEKGLHGVMVSVNPFYLEYIPFERTQRAVKCCYEVFGKNTMVYQTGFFNRFSEQGIYGKVSFDEYLRMAGNRQVWEEAEFFIMGRAPYSLGEELALFFPRYPAEAFFTVSCAPPFLRNWHNHFDNYGNYIPGYCGGITFGDCREFDLLLGRGIRREEYPCLSFIADGDFKGLFAFALEYGYRKRKEGYFSKCHLCVDMRKHLFDNGSFSELAPSGFYRQLM
jgi:hypothetical protein